MGTVTVCVATRNNARCIELTAEAIAAACAMLEADVIFVENASTDETLSMLKAIDNAKVLPLDKNVGFAAAYNMAMQHATGEYMLLLNADAALHPSAIERMAESLDADDRLAAVGPRVIDEDNRLLHSIVVEPSLIRALGQSFIRHIFPKATRALRESVRSRPVYEPVPRTVPVRMVDGVCVLFRTSAIREVGAFDELFFFDHEAIELGERLTNAAYTIAQRQDAAVTHLGGGGHSRRSEPDAIIWSTESGLRLYARRGLRMFVPYFVGTAVFVGLRAAFEQVASVAMPSRRHTSEQYRSLLRSVWSLRRCNRNWEAATRIASISGPAPN